MSCSLSFHLLLKNLPNEIEYKQKQPPPREYKDQEFRNFEKMSYNWPQKDNQLTLQEIGLLKLDMKKNLQKKRILLSIRGHSEV